MGRRLLVYIRQLTQAQRGAIRAAAEARGFEAVICDELQAAKSAAGEAEVVFSADLSLMDAAGGLKWLCVPSAGADQYIEPVRARPGLMLSNSSGAYGVTIAEHIVMVTLELMRRQPEYQRLVAKRGWRRDLPVRSIRDSRVVLLGTGDIGREAALRLRAFGPKSILGVNRRGRAPGDMFDAVYPIDELDAVLPQADLLILSLPGTAGTSGLMDDGRLGLMPRDAFIVNVGRGSAIDPRALERRLREGQFAGVALDVFETEPLPPEDTLWDCPRLLITPHVAGNMTLPYTVERIAALFLEDFENYCEGRPLARRVALDQGY